jgi:hypothetical protein
MPIEIRPLRGHDDLDRRFRFRPLWPTPAEPASAEDGYVV